MKHLNTLRLFSFWALSLFGLLSSASAQQWALSGRVTDAQTGTPLAGAMIRASNNPLIVFSNDNGQFVLKNLPAGQCKLQITLIGYTSREEILDLTRDTEMDIALQSGAVNMAEITVQSSGAHHRQILSQIDVRLRPVLNSQEILRMVPGLFMGQHAGGGKAEQIFLRGFDIDHGTDIQINVDGMPVNMVSHAHGQGYADLHFVIPELVETVQFDKGPYQADKGNFTTAGWVDFRTKTALERSFAKLELGQYGTARGVVGINLLPRSRATERNQSAYIAGEYSYSDSYFDAPQFFNRANVQGRYSADIGKESHLVLTGSHFWSRWNHSGQIPDRSVESGEISFFGSIDPTEGGETSRSNVNLQLNTQLPNGALLKNQVYATRYDFELYSNFTFFLVDSLNGDQIRQKEGRNLFGYNGSYTLANQIGNVRGRFVAGLQYRHDDVRDVELSRSSQRTVTLEQIQLGNVAERNAGAYLLQELNFNRRWTAEIALRYDYFFNRYTDHLQNEQQFQKQSGLLLPKFNLSYTVSDRLKWVLNTGRGFHSNDTRVAAMRSGREVLPPAYGTDLGAIWKPSPRLLIHTAAWYLWLDQEFVYVGDAGVVEPGGKTQRYGLDLSARYQLLSRLHADFDLNWTRPRAIEEPEGEQYIPLAPVFTTVGGLSLSDWKGFSGSLRYRYLRNRPANEDNSVVAEGYFVPDLQLNYRRNNWELGLNVQNLLNTRWKETQFNTESRLRNEPEPVEEIHFTPGTPFFARLAFTLYF